jgi:arginyl-tRNA synthetase
MITCLEIEARIRKALEAAARASVGGQELASPILLEQPKDDQFGDFTTNFALKLAKEARKSPRALADDVVARFKAGDPEAARLVADIKVEGPGFINLFLDRSALTAVVEEVFTDPAFGADKPSSHGKMLVEYVSANPTGPLTIAHGRQAALGDTLVRVLRHAGWDASSEYYNNDIGVQIKTLGLSLYERCREAAGLEANFPENGYKGDYVKTMASELLAQKGGSGWLEPRDPAIKACMIHARETIMATILKDLEDFDVRFDSIFSQEKLEGSGQVEATLAELQQRGEVFEAEGALWLRTTPYGDDKDRVVRKSDGNFTYLMPDIAYHRDKFRRGYDSLVDILGPDHHGYIARIKASQKALGNDPDKLHIKIAQLVSLYEGDKQLRMSTRAGEFITLRELMDEVGKDAARFFFLMRKFDSHLEFDLELAKKQSPDNPVYYIQYGHARVSSIRKNYEAKVGAFTLESADLSLLSSPEEARVLRALRNFGGSVRVSARELEPCILVEYLQGLAANFHSFYQKHRVVEEGQDPKLSAARMALCLSIQKVLKIGLKLLGVSAPESM